MNILKKINRKKKMMEKLWYLHTDDTPKSTPKLCFMTIYDISGHF